LNRTTRRNRSCGIDGSTTTRRRPRWTNGFRQQRLCGQRRGRIEGGIEQAHPRGSIPSAKVTRIFSGASQFRAWHLAYGSFLNDIGDEDASVQFENETARQLDPKNPAAWNNLANYYGEHGPITNAFIYYAKAIELNPNEPVYYQNFATTVYLYRKDAREFYGITEQQVFDKALALYQQGHKARAG
jgi:tetratricopeptide (TPR) repeat protein